MAFTDYINSAAKGLIGANPDDSWKAAGRQTMRPISNLGQRFGMYGNPKKRQPQVQSSAYPQNEDDENNWG